MLAVRRRPSVRRFATALALMFAVAPVARAQVLDLVPSDAVAVIKVKNVAGVSTKAGKFFTDLGVAAFKPELGDPLAAIQEQSGIKNGVNRDGDLAIVVMNRKQQGGAAPAEAPGAQAAPSGEARVILAQDQQPPAGQRRGGLGARANRGGGGGNMEPSGLALIPVSDYKAFLTNFTNPQELENGITQVSVPNNPRPQYVANWGNYAAMSPDRAAVSKKPAGVKPTGTVAKELDAKDLVVYVNTPELRKTALPMLQGSRQQIMDQLTANISKDPATAKFSNMFSAMVGKYMDLAEAFLRDSDGAAFSVNLNDAGVNFAALSDFKPESELGKNVARLKGTDQPLTAGIPSGKYIFYGGYQVDPKLMSEVIDTFVAPMISAMKADTAAGGGVGADGDAAITKAVDAAKKSTQAVNSASFAMVAPRAALGTESLFQGFMVVHGDAKAYTAANREYFTSLNSILGQVTAAAGGAGAGANAADANKPAGNAPAMTMSGQVKENAKTVDGVSFDQFTMNITADTNTPQGAQAQQAIAMMYGPGGLNYYSGAVNDKTALLVFGGSDTLISNAIKGAKANDTALAKQENVKAVDAQLPQNRVAVGYFALDELVNTVVTYAKQFGLPANVQLPPDLPPIAGAVATEGSSARIEGTVPTQLVQSITAAVLQTMQQMQGPGGGAGANPGGL